MPENINIGSNLQNTFAKVESEWAAVSIISYCRQTEPKGWKSFTFAGIENFITELKKGDVIAINLWQLNLMPGLRFLDAGGWIKEDAGTFHVTDDFIKRCYKKHPATGEKKGE